MILYRLRGRAEAWPYCGLIHIVPVISGNISALMVTTKAYIKTLEKAKKHYRLVVEKLTINTPTKKEWIQALSSDSVDDLFYGRKELKKWEG